MSRALVSVLALVGFVLMGCGVRFALSYGADATPEDTIRAAGEAASGVMPRLPRRAASAASQ